MNTYKSKYGDITLYANEEIIGPCFARGEYWEEANLLLMAPYINPDKNILEIGAHCGTSTVFYARKLNPGRKVYAFEPQKGMFDLLVKNIQQNDLEDKVVAINKAVFCFSGVGKMNSDVLDCSGGNVSRRLTDEKHLPCNFGGLHLGKSGEDIVMTTIDSEPLLAGGADFGFGFVHSDAQGVESYIFSKASQFLAKHRPVILYENYLCYGRYLFDSVRRDYPQYEQESKFDLKNHCMIGLGYSKCIDNIGGFDTLLIPAPK